MPSPDPEFFTASDVRDLLQVSKMTVYRLAHAGELNHIRMGRSIRIFSSSVRDYIARSVV